MIPENMKTKKFALDPEKMPDFSVFVQSTSHNRVVLPGTKMLFNVGDSAEVIDTEAKEEEEKKDTTTTRRSKRTAASAKETAKPAVEAKKRPKAEAPAKPAKRGRKAKEEEPTVEVVEAAVPVATAGGPPPPPGGPIEIAFSFDTTGEKLWYLNQINES